MDPRVLVMRRRRKREMVAMETFILLGGESCCRSRAGLAGASEAPGLRGC